MYQVKNAQQKKDLDRLFIQWVLGKNRGIEAPLPIDKLLLLVEAKLVNKEQLGPKEMKLFSNSRNIDNDAKFYATQIINDTNKIHYARKNQNLGKSDFENKADVLLEQILFYGFTGTSMHSFFQNTLKTLSKQKGEK